MKLVIKNSEWLRGMGCGVLFDNGSSGIKTGCYCVQGLFCKANGVADEIMSHRTSVVQIFRDEEIERDNYPAIGWMMTTLECGTLASSGEALKITGINDNPHTTDAEKIELLRPIFAAHGVEIEYREGEEKRMNEYKVIKVKNDYYVGKSMSELCAHCVNAVAATDLCAQLNRLAALEAVCGEIVGNAPKEKPPLGTDYSEYRISQKLKAVLEEA